MPPVVETRSGKHVNILSPKVTDIVISDIAYNLSRMPRFNGSTIGAIAYSLAQHAVWATVIAEYEMGVDAITALQVLVAPSYKAYTFDIGEPIKRLPELVESVSELESGLQMKIFQALQLPTPTDRVRDVTRKAYLAAHSIEAHHLMPSGGRPWTSPPPNPGLLTKFLPPISAEHSFQLFMLAYNQLLDGSQVSKVWMEMLTATIKHPHHHMNS
jgi:hypothetical protein